jgi:hypothetical protein
MLLGGGPAYGGFLSPGWAGGRGGSAGCPVGRRQKASSAESPLGVVTLSDATNLDDPGPVDGPDPGTLPVWRRRVSGDRRTATGRGGAALTRAGPGRVRPRAAGGYASGVHRRDELFAAGAATDDDRLVDLTDDDFRVLPDQSVDDTDRGWGELPASNDDRLLAERPPHWD